MNSTNIGIQWSEAQDLLVKALKHTEYYQWNSLLLIKINLCDPAVEPSDEDLASLMDCVAIEAVKRNEQATRMLSDEIDREIAKNLGRMP